MIDAALDEEVLATDGDRLAIRSRTRQGCGNGTSGRGARYGGAALNGRGA